MTDERNLPSMKIRIDMTIDVDPAAWDMEYGTGTDRAAVAEDARSLIFEAIWSLPGGDYGLVRDAHRNR